MDSLTINGVSSCSWEELKDGKGLYTWSSWESEDSLVSVLTYKNVDDVPKSEEEVLARIISGSREEIRAHLLSIGYSKSFYIATYKSSRN